MLSKDQKEVLERPKPDASTNMLLVPDGGQKSREQSSNAYLNNGGSNDPPEGRG